MKRIAKFCTFLLVLLLILNIAIPAFAAGSVTYDGDANKFIFAPGSEDSLTNVFADFQSVMPGDTITEQILIKNKQSNNVKIKVYMRSHGAQEGTDDLMSQMKLTVKQKGDSVLFSAPADESAGLADWVYLGTVYSGGEITLDVTLEVPITMGNEYQNKTGYIDWEFMVEELPVEPSDPDQPKTGDTSNLILYLGIFVFSLAMLILLLFFRKKKEEEE